LVFQLFIVRVLWAFHLFLARLLLTCQQLVIDSKPCDLMQLIFIFLVYRACAFLLRLNLVLVFATLLQMHLMLLEVCGLEFVAVVGLFLILICLFQAILKLDCLMFGLDLVWLIKEHLIFVLQSQEEQALLSFRLLLFTWLLRCYRLLYFVST
jgi:hypothetical protein